RLLFPTMTATEMSGLRTALWHDRRCRAAHYHLLFRRNAYDDYTDSFDAQEWTVHPLRVGFTLLAEVARELQVHFYTDTDPLTEHYNRFDTESFTTLPIPVEVVAQASATDPSSGGTMAISPGKTTQCQAP